MPISVTCPNNHKLSVPDGLVGKNVTCPTCSASVFVSQQAQAQSAAASDAARKKSESKIKANGSIKEATLLALAVSGGLFLGMVMAGALLAFVKSAPVGKQVATGAPNTESAPPPPSPQERNFSSVPAVENGHSVASEASSPSRATQPSLDDLPADEKKKINVFGYDIDKRTALADMLVKDNVAKFKANTSVMIVAGKLVGAANSLGLTPDEQNHIAFPIDTKFEQMFNEGTLMDEVDTEILPEVFVPLIEKYSKGTATPQEKELAFFVLAAFYLSEIK